MSRYIGKRVFYQCDNCGNDFTLSKKTIDDSLNTGNVFCSQSCYNQKTMRKQKYNPTNIQDLSKGKVQSKVGYRKGTFLHNIDDLVDVIKNGGQVEVKAEEVRELNGHKISVIECKIYFIDK